MQAFWLPCHFTTPPQTAWSDDHMVLSDPATTPADEKSSVTLMPRPRGFERTVRCQGLSSLPVLHHDGDSADHRLHWSLDSDLTQDV